MELGGDYIHIHIHKHKVARQFGLPLHSTSWVNLVQTGRLQTATVKLCIRGMIIESLWRTWPTLSVQATHYLYTIPG